MKRTLNVKFLAVLVVGLILFSSGVHFLHAYQVKRNAKALLELADREAVLADQSAKSANWLEERRHLLAATNYLSHYLDYMPRDVDVLVKYGLLLEQMASVPGSQLRAYRTFETILILDPENHEDPHQYKIRHDIRRKLARMAMQVKHYADAQTHLEILYKDPKLVNRADKAKLEQLLGQCCEANGKLQSDSKNRIGAKEYFERAKLNAPDQIESYVSLANLFRHRLKRPTEADRVMMEMIGKNEKSPKAYLAYLARANYWKENKVPDKAAKDIERAYLLAPDYELVLDDEFPPDDVNLFLLFAELALDRGKLAASARKAGKAFQEARGALKRGLQFYPLNPDLYLLFAGVELAENKPEEAEASLKRGLNALPGHNQLLWTLANLMLDNGKNDEHPELTDAIGRIKKGGVLPALLAYLEGRIQINQGHWPKAIQILEGIRPELMKDREMVHRIDLWLGQCYNQLDEPDMAYAAYRRALEPDPLDVPACLGMSSALLAMGRIDEAIETYRRIVAKSPLAKLETARLLIRKNLGLAEEQRQWKKIEEYLNDAETAKALPVDVVLLRAQVQLAQGKKERARELLEKARDKLPKQVELWIALADVVAQQRKSEEALAILGRAMQELGDRVALRLARVEYWANQEASEAKPALAKLEKDLQQFSSPDRRQILKGLASSYARLREMQEAKRLWNQLAKEQPDDLNIRLILFDIALESGDEPGINRLLKEIKSIADSDGALCQFCEARYLIWQAAETRQDQKGDEASKGLLAEARNLLKKMAKHRPLWSGIPLCEALIEEVKQSSVPEDERDYRKALEDYSQAIRQGERNPAVIRRVVQLLYERKQYREADEILKKLPDSMLLTADLQRLAAEVSFQLRDYGRALKLAQGIADESKDYRDHLRLAELLWALGEREKVEPVLEACVQVLQGGLGAKEDLVRVQEWLEAKQPKKSARFTVCLAVLRDLQGDYQGAERLYREAIVKDPNNFVALNNLAWLLALDKRGAEALDLVSRAIKIAGPLPGLLDTQGLAYMAKGDAEAASQALEKATDDPDPQAAFSFHLAEAQLMRKNRSAAAIAWKQAEKLGLTREHLHPLERSAYDQLRHELKP